MFQYLQPGDQIGIFSPSSPATVTSYTSNFQVSQGLQKCSNGFTVRTNVPSGGKEVVYMIRDRGRKKWTAMMLPEHLTKLRDWVGEDSYEEKPAIDEWMLQEFQQQLDIAYQSQCEMYIRTWEKGLFAVTTGILTRLDEQAQLIYIVDEGMVQKILLNTIVGIETI